MSQPTLAIVILNWNGKSLLEVFLPDVVANSVWPGVRVVVADNASTDGSLDFVKSRFSEVDTIAFDQNHGFAGGYNKALELLGDDYFILLNSDAVPEKGWLAPIFNLIAQHGSLDVAMPKIRSHKNPTHFEYAGAAGGFIDRYGYPFCRGRIMDVVEPDNGQYNQPSELFWASGAALVIRSELYRQVGGLDEDFFAHMEEIDLCWRLKNRGCNVLYVPESVVYHVGGASLHHSHPRKTYLNFRNNLYMLLKNLPKGELFKILFVRMALDGVAALKFLLSLEFGFFAAVFKAHLSFYANFNLFWKKRKVLMQTVVCDKHPQIFHGSIVWQFFIAKHRTFDQLPFKEKVK